MSIDAGFDTFAQVGAGLVTWTLGGLGMVVAAIGTERGVVLFRTRGDGARLRAALGLALGRGDLDAARRCVAASRSVEAEVVAAGLAALPRGAAAIEERMASEARLTRLGLERGVALLRMAASSAPLIGLLGTILGIVRVVQPATCGAPLEIHTTLATTVLGLSIAILASVLFAFFERKIAARLLRAEALGRYMLSFVKDERRSLENRPFEVA